MRNHANASRFKMLPLAAAMFGCLYGTTAIAQEAPAQDKPATQESKKEEAKTLEKITVTGSLLRRLEYDTTSPVQVITADTSVAIGQTSTAEFLQKSSVASGSTQISHQFAGFVTEGGTGAQTISLRGLGASRTAVLLNGNRPGPAGVRGQVLAFDLNVIPQSIVQRIEIVKDGSSSIYGSDALAGAVNIITRTNIDRPEISINGRMPFEGGGENFTLSGATGWNFDNGNIMVAAEYYLHKPLRMGDRDYLRCSEDLFWNANGERIDREYRGNKTGNNCNNLLVNVVDDAYLGPRYVPTWDGTTIGLLPGYRPNVTGNYDPANPQIGQAYHYQPTDLAAFDDVQIIDRQERANVFASANFQLGDVNWATEFLYNRRTTETYRLRQFFPLIGGTTSPLASYRYTDGSTFAAPVPGGIARPVLPFSSMQDVKVDYYFLNTSLDGLIKSSDSWAWKANLSHSESSGEYNNFAILKSLTGDADPALRPWTGGKSPSINYFEPCILDGSCMSKVEDAIGRWVTGETKYRQTVMNLVFTGELFDLPAGPVGLALGGEFRQFAINDQPSTAERNGDLWGQSSAVATKGDDNVKEVFMEAEVPLLKGKPMFESLSLNLSARAFDYASVHDDDFVWKAGLSWQINPTVRLRATKGTSFRAPGLYELYLGNLSGFLAQTSIDPCLKWGESNNDFLKANCAAAGIPADYNATGGSASSAQTFTGGGAGFLKPERSNAFTGGIVLTPTAWPLSVALDYFDYEVRDQIGTLSAATILAGCYGAEAFPNSFCDMFSRNPNNHPTAPNKIEEVHVTYVNINKQKVRGYDLLTRFDKAFSFGKLEVEGQFTYMMEDFSQLFSTSAASGFTTSDRNGSIGRPKLVGNVRTALKRGDWNYTWFMDYVGPSKALTLAETTTYNGWPNAVRDIKADSRIYHAVSVLYSQPKWSLLVGVRNLLDKDPPEVSSGVADRYGNVPAFATQYDYYGRSLFTRFTYKF